MQNKEANTISQDQWDISIEPKTAMFNLNLKELWRYKDLMWLFVKRDFSAQYKQTILGPLWHFIQPLFTTIVFLVVFGQIAKIPIPKNIAPAVFYMSGITIWNYFTSCLTGTSNTFVANAAIFGKVYFPRLVIPVSVVLSNIVKFSIQFLLLLLVMGYYGIKTGNFYIGWTWLLIPVLVVMMALMGLGFGIIISSLTTKYRDFTVLIGFAIQLLMYATPVIYPLEYFNNSKYKPFIEWNPLTPIIEAFRYAVLGEGTFTITSLLYSSSFILVSVFFGSMIFTKVEKSFMDTV
ncbi:ABC transporter permease [Ferruginibacter sp. SUN002]|uniref:ABC transporter permease n=1 Tax=Ferruginibacter sp. SUN002 TaxID=2937789 RepID=UPI003D35B944